MNNRAFVHYEVVIVVGVLLVTIITLKPIFALLHQYIHSLAWAIIATVAAIVVIDVISIIVFMTVVILYEKYKDHVDQ